MFRCQHAAPLSKRHLTSLDAAQDREAQDCLLTGFSDDLSSEQALDEFEALEALLAMLENPQHTANNE